MITLNKDFHNIRLIEKTPSSIVEERILAYITNKDHTKKYIKNKLKNKGELEER